MYDGQGNKTWDCTLDIYGKVLAVDKGTEFDCPFRFQGQYADEETGLYYNRFRYYLSDIGGYVNQDLIGLAGNNPTLYTYVKNTNTWIDIFGLTPKREVNGIPIYGKGQTTGPGHAQMSEFIANKLAMSGEFTEIHLNRSYEAITGIPTTPKRSPDVTAIDKYGRVHVIEIASDSDMKTNAKFNNLTSRNAIAQGQLPPKMQGEIIVIKKPYNAGQIKTQIDDLIKKAH
jgi:RHS repeat-associated protein